MERAEADGTAERDPLDAEAERLEGPVVGERCDYCGAETLTWRKCKLICTSCSQINKSCADL